MLVTKKNLKPVDPYDVSAWNAFYELNPGHRRSIGADGDNDDTGGAGGDDKPKIQDSDEFKAALASGVEALLEQRVNGLKTKNDDLVKKSKTISDKLASFGDLDPESVKAMMATLNQSEEARLIAEGKLDEVISSRVDKIESEAAEKIAALTEKLTVSDASGASYKDKYERKTIDDSVRAQCIKQGVLPHAMDDVIRRAGDIFSIGEDGGLEARGSDGALLKNAELLLINPERFVENLKTSSPHYWPTSQSSGSRGSGATGGEYADEMAKLNDMTKGGEIDMAEYRKQRKKMSGDDYNAKR